MCRSHPEQRESGRGKARDRRGTLRPGLAPAGRTARPSCPRAVQPGRGVPAWGWGARGGFAEGPCAALGSGAPHVSAVALTRGFGVQRGLWISAGREFMSNAFPLLLHIDRSSSFPAESLQRQFFFFFAGGLLCFFKMEPLSAESLRPIPPPPWPHHRSPRTKPQRSQGAAARVPKPWPNSGLFDIPAKPGPTRRAGTVFVWRTCSRPFAASPGLTDTHVFSADLEFSRAGGRTA